MRTKYKSAFTTERKLNFRLRVKSKKGDIASHWESVSSLNCLVISKMFRHLKDRPDSLPSKFPNTLLMCFLNYEDGNNFKWHDILVEANGMIFDLFVFGFLLSIYESMREKGQRVERYLEEIDDYRGWDDKEASYRIYGIVKRLCKDGAKQMNLSRCNLSRQDLSKLNLINPNFHKADLSYARLSKVSYSGVDLSGANLSGANLSGADLSGANMHRSNLKGTNLSNANLKGANLSNSTLIDANLHGADLSGADLRNAVLSNYESDYWLRLELLHEDVDYNDIPDEFIGYDPDEFYNENSHYKGANLSLANLTGAILSNANLNYVDLENANLTGADLFQSELLGADLRGANLLGANLTEADLSDVKLDGAIVRDTWMERIVTNRVYAHDEILEKYSLIEHNGTILLKKKI